MTAIVTVAGVTIGLPLALLLTLWKPPAKPWKMDSKILGQKLVLCCPGWSAQLWASFLNLRASDQLSHQAHLAPDFGSSCLYCYKLPQKKALTPRHKHQSRDFYRANDGSHFVYFVLKNHLKAFGSGASIACFIRLEELTWLTEAVVALRGYICSI